MTPSERAAAKRAATEARRQANREAWARSPINANFRREDALAAVVPEVIEPVADTNSSSASLARMRAIMADAGTPLYRRLDAAEVVLTYELGPGAAAGVDPEQIAAGAYRFLKAVSESSETPEALRFRALKSVVTIENTRKAAVQSPAAHFANREFFRRLINAARSTALREAGTWQQVVDSGARWSLGPHDDFIVPELPRLDVRASIEKDGPAEYLDACNRMPKDVMDRYHAERAAILRAVKATNRPDNWEQWLCK